MQKPILHIFQSRYFIVPVGILTLLLVSILWYFASIKDLVLFPNPQEFQSGAYTDEANGGNSEILQFQPTDSVLALHFQLNPAFHSPYVGISTGPIKTRSVNTSKYNEVNLKIRGGNIDKVGISLFTPPLNDSHENSKEETIYHTFLQISSIAQTYSIPIAQFTYPEWWEETHQVSTSKQEKPNLGEILHFNVGSAFSPDIDSPKTLEIYSISFSRNNKILFRNLIIIYFALIFIYTTLLLITTNKKEKEKHITVAYKPVETEQKDTVKEKCLAFINQEFSNNEISLEYVAAKTGISARRITQIIQDDFQCNFKTYINRIRITESKRLLETTQMHIGEIAFKVGFNNQSHFNRVFKAEEQMNPSEYRNQHL